MRVRLALSVLCLVALAAAGCRVASVHNPVNNLPPAERIMHPGPGVGGPGPGVIPPMGPFGPGAFAVAPPVQVLFESPGGMHVRWVTGMGFSPEPLITPGRYNFPQGAVYQIKLSDIEGYPGIELYPTLEIGPATPRTTAYLEHNAIPIQFTGEDFDQVLTGNFVTKVIYLPDPEFQELALAGVETLVSTRLDPGVDPIVEADRRGAILAIIRMGNKDLELPVPIDFGAGGGGEFIYEGQYGPPAGSGMAPGPYGASNRQPAELDELAAAEAAPLEGEIQQVGYYDYESAGPHVGHRGSHPVGPMPSGYAMGGAPMAIAPGYGAMPPYISGVNAPPWGLPISGTPIGLPGPPHIPFGVPAGLQQHTMHDYTYQNIGGPTPRVNVAVRHSPGYVYPRPANTAVIHERTLHRAPLFRQPYSDRFYKYRGGHGNGGYCP